MIIRFKGPDDVPVGINEDKIVAIKTCTDDETGEIVDDIIAVYYGAGPDDFVIVKGKFESIMEIVNVGKWVNP